jgi:hypothetical protein
MLSRLSNPCHSVTDLAASLTDSALEALSETGVRGDSVAMELGLWHALTDVLKRVLCAA